MYYIYVIRKQGIPVYVGFTSKTIEERWKQHIKHLKSRKYILYNSMLKNGIECFTIEQLYESEDFEHTLNYMEHHFIWLYKTYYEYGGYNMTLGGEGTIKLATLSEKERVKQYKEKNKDKIKQQKKKYREQNKDKIKQYKKEYTEKNKNKLKEYKKEYTEKNKNKNKDNIREYSKKYYIENKEKIKEKTKKYSEQNKDKIKEYKKEYKQKNKEKINEKKRLNRKLKIISSNYH